MLGETISSLRKKQGMSQQTLADAVFVTRQTISKWEKNLSVPDADALVRLADALDVSVQTLLGQPESTPAEPSDLAAALMRINDQLAIQNRRRSRLWKIVAWVVGLIVAFQLPLLACAGMLQFDEGPVMQDDAVIVEYETTEEAEE